MRRIGWQPRRCKSFRAVVQIPGFAAPMSAHPRLSLIDWRNMQAESWVWLTGAGVLIR